LRDRNFHHLGTRQEKRARGSSGLMYRVTRGFIKSSKCPNCKKLILDDDAKVKYRRDVSSCPHCGFVLKGDEFRCKKCGVLCGDAATRAAHERDCVKEKKQIPCHKEVVKKKKKKLAIPIFTRGYIKRLPPDRRLIAAILHQCGWIKIADDTRWSV